MKIFTQWLLVSLLAISLCSAANEKQPSAEQLAQVRIPKTEFKNATVSMCLEFLREKAVHLARPHQLNINNIGRTPSTARITLTLENAPLIEVLWAIARQANLTMGATETGIYLYPIGEKPDL